MITGESIPVAKGEGDTVVGGTANQHGSVFVRADRVGEDTMLAQVRHTELVNCFRIEPAQLFYPLFKDNFFVCRFCAVLISSAFLYVVSVARVGTP